MDRTSRLEVIMGGIVTSAMVGAPKDCRLAQKIHESDLRPYGIVTPHIFAFQKVDDWLNKIFKRDTRVQT